MHKSHITGEVAVSAAQLFFMAAVELQSEAAHVIREKRAHQGHVVATVSRHVHENHTSKDTHVTEV